MKIRMTTISPVILSPRTEKALYKGVDFKEISEKNTTNLKIKKVSNINIVYPFYSYDDRNLLSESPFLQAKEYYIPASSFKGALLGNKKDDIKNNFRNKILFHDVRIENSHIKIGNLYKFQYLYQEIKEKDSDKKQKIIYKTPKFAPFFPGVVIEMIDSEKEFEGEILLKISDENFNRELRENFNITNKKLKNYIQEIENRIKDIHSWIEEKKIKKQNEEKEDYIDKLEKIKCRIQYQLESKKNMIFLGGYKGILGSLSQEIKLEKNHGIKNGFYIDECTLLPYGLVEVKLE